MGATPTVPPPPSYVGAATPTTPITPAQSNTTLWDLGTMYNQPIYLGTNYTGYQDAEAYGYKPGKPLNSATNAFGTTQGLEQQIMQLWSSQDAERVKNPNSLTSYEQLQQSLYAGGFYGQTAYNSIHVGQWTSQTQTAIYDAMKSYEQVMQGGQQPVTFSEFLNSNANGGAAGGFAGGASGAAPTQVNLADPKALRAAAQQAAQQALGQGLTQSQLNKFVTQFQSLQTADQTGTGSSVTTPDLTSQANAFAQQQDPNAYKNYQADSYTDTLLNMFLPAASARPNITPTPTA